MKAWVALAVSFALATIGLARSGASWTALVVEVAGVGILAAAVVMRRPGLVGWGLAAIGVAVVVGEQPPTQILDLRWPAYAASLLLLAELSYGAVEEREVAHEEDRVRRERIATTARLVVAGYVVAWIALVAASMPMSPDAGTGVLAAVGTTATIAWLRLVIALVPSGTAPAAADPSRSRPLGDLSAPRGE